MTNANRDAVANSLKDTPVARGSTLGTIANPATVLDIHRDFVQRHCTACGRKTRHLVTQVHTNLGHQDIVRCFDATCPESR